MSLPVQIKQLETDKVERIQRLASAFAGVFGQDHQRSSDQRLVVAALAELCGHSKAHNLLDQQGRIDPSSAIFNEGSRTVYLFIEGQLKTAASLNFSQATTPKKQR